MGRFTTFAADCSSNVGQLCVDSLPKGTANSANIQNMIQVVIVIMGAIALLVIVIAGLRYILSQGDPQKVAQAKNAIIYAVIGLIIVMFAQVIVAFVVNKV